MTGSPLFAQQKITSIAFAPRLPADVKLFVQLKDGRRTFSPVFRGNLTGGTEFLKFDAALPSCPLAVSLKVRRPSAEVCAATVTWRWTPSVWIGQQLAFLPWVEPLAELLGALTEEGSQLGFNLCVNVSYVGDAIAPAQAELDQLRQIKAYVEALGQARHVARVLKLQVRVPADWEEQDLEDIEELYSLVTTGRYRSPHRCDFDCTMSRLPHTVAEGLKREDHGNFEMRDHGSNYHFLGATIDFSDTKYQFSGWHEAIVEDVDEEGEPATKLQLNGCTKTVVWPRFLPRHEDGCDGK